MNKEDMIGKVCVSDQGRIGIIKSYREDSQGVLYEGERVSGGGRWASRRPILLDTADVHNLILRVEDTPEEDTPSEKHVKESVRDDNVSKQGRPIDRVEARSRPSRGSNRDIKKK